MSECVSRWSLEIGDPFPYAFTSVAVRATLPDGRAVVLKVQFPDRESEHEAAALAAWAGEGAVLLIDDDPERRALLLERCEPGWTLSELDQDEALDVMVGLLPRLWKPAGGPFRSLREEAAWWAEGLEASWERAGAPFDRRLLDAALDALNELPPSQGEQVLIHQDLHAGNVLRATREPWLVIDPKPLVGEREAGIAALIRGDELGRGPGHVRHRLRRLCDELGLDSERARRWALAQTVAWAFTGEEVLADHVECATWLLAEG
jgi:streptomycin 6-kinase